jgi:transposase
MLNQPLFAALDVSLATTTICIMSADGTIIKEAVVATEPESIAICLGDDLTRIERIGLEAGPLSEWLVRELSVLGIVITLLETRQVRAALSAMIIKTDRKDARGMAHLLRTGWFRPVHVKSLSAREQRAMLAARSMLVARLKDIENSVRGLLRGFGLRLPRALRGAGRPVFERQSKVTLPWCRFSNRCSWPAKPCGSN